MRLSFDKKAKDWDDNRRIQRSKVIADKIIDYVKLQESFTGLEFGCGTGLISLNLYDKLSKITCIDTSSGMIKQLEDKVAEHNLDKITVTQLNINEDHDLKSEYDIIYSSMSLHHVINVKIIMNTFAHIKMYIFNLQQASYGLLIYKTFLKLKLHGNDEGFYPKLHLQQLHHKKYHPMN